MDLKYFLCNWSFTFPTQLRFYSPFLSLPCWPFFTHIGFCHLLLRGFFSFSEEKTLVSLVAYDCLNLFCQTHACVCSPITQNCSLYWYSLCFFLLWHHGMWSGIMKLVGMSYSLLVFFFNLLVFLPGVFHK